MKARVRTAAVAGLALASGGAAFAAEPVLERDLGVAVLASASDGEALTARAWAFAQPGWVFQNQLEAGFGVGVVAERDDPHRDPRGGRVGACTPARAGCASLGGAPVRGFVSGHYTSGPAADEDARLALESAYLYIRHGWGEVSVGRDQGAARRLSVTPPTILTIGGGLDAPVDGTGLGGVILRNDISGQSAKIFAATTRIVGLQAALSYAPEQEHEGIDQGYQQRAGAPLVFEPEEIVEGGLSFAHTFVNGWETAAGVTYAHAENKGGRAAFDAMSAWSVGATLAQGDWRFGASYLENDNGWATGGRAYRAVGVSGVRERGDWALMLEAGASSDDLVFVDTKTITGALRRKVSDHLAIAGGASFRSLKSPVGGASARTGWNEDGFGGFVEISLGL